MEEDDDDENVCFDFLYNSETFLILRRNEWEMIINVSSGLHVKCRYSCQILMKLEFLQIFFFKYSNINLHENLSRGSQVVPCGHTDIQTDMTKLTVPFYSFVNLPKKVISVTFPPYSAYWPRLDICSFYLSCGSLVTTHLCNLNIFTL